MKKILLLIVAAILIAFSSEQLVRAQNPDDKQGAQHKKTSGIFTLYAMDPSARSLCLNDGKEGTTFSIQ